MEQQFDIHILAFEGPSDRAITGLQQQFGLNRDQALRLVSSAPVLARAATESEEARAYQEALQALGAVVEVRASHAPEATAATSGIIRSQRTSEYDSSIQLAARIPKAPPLPAEAGNVLQQLTLVRPRDRRAHHQRGLVIGILLLVVGALGGVYYRLQTRPVSVTQPVHNAVQTSENGSPRP